MKRLSLLAALAALTFALAACGEKHDQLGPGKAQPLTVMLDWFPNADHVGLYQAIAEGDFTRAGLDVHVEVPSNPASPRPEASAPAVSASWVSGSAVACEVVSGLSASGAGGSLSAGSLSANAMRRISSNSLSDGNSLTSLRPN